jgi:hypothetical protein
VAGRFACWRTGTAFWSCDPHPSSNVREIIPPVEPPLPPPPVLDGARENLSVSSQPTLWIRWKTVIDTTPAGVVTW